MTRRAVVLFNLGGPDSLEAVQPFLFNLFRDRAIIALPNPLRWLVARLIAARRSPTARQIYARMGNASPLLANTVAQAEALEAALGPDHRVFVAMRYWRPFAAETVAAVKAWQPDEVVLLPLYPQFSSTTTGSSLTDWRRAAAAARLAAPVRALCCYPQEHGFVQAVAQAVGAALQAWPAGDRVRVLFSAHGLPKKTVARGDPYAWQVERTVTAVLSRLGRPALDAVLCFQSRVGPLEWLGPSTDAEVRRAGREGVGLVVVPIAFVSEHSETLVELDIEYRHLAEAAGVPRYVRVATVGTAAGFIAGLAALARAAAGSTEGVACPAGGRRLCPGSFVLCPCAEPAR